jgi:hypothetical protein
MVGYHPGGKVFSFSACCGNVVQMSVDIPVLPLRGYPQKLFWVGIRIDVSSRPTGMASGMTSVMLGLCWAVKVALLVGPLEHCNWPPNHKGSTATVRGIFPYLGVPLGIAAT